MSAGIIVHVEALSVRSSFTVKVLGVVRGSNAVFVDFGKEWREKNQGRDNQKWNSFHNLIIGDFIDLR